MAKANSRTTNNGNGLDTSAPNGGAFLTTNDDLLRSVTNPLGQLITIKLEEDNYLL